LLSHFIVDYVGKLIDLLFNTVIYRPSEYKQLISSIEVPPNLCAEFVHPNRSVAASSFTSRFNVKTAADKLVSRKNED
jgi:hypothetical protein